MLERDILRIISNAPERYVRYTIPKRSGGKRNIAQPARELKVLQRALIEIYSEKLPVHRAATAYRKGMSIRDNAVAHAENGPILKIDFVNFFNSIRSTDWHSYCEDRGLFQGSGELYESTQILFHRASGLRGLRLAIGAPSSPLISNALMFEFDARITEEVGRDFVTYTRYADDITFSARRTGYLVNVEKSVRKVINDIAWPQLKINLQKTVVATKKYHRQVTGLVLTNDGKVSLGRDRKRQLRAAVHRAIVGELSVKQIAALAGKLAFANAVEPEFIRRLEKHYGEEALQAIKRAPFHLYG
jgi:hypothetical protein